MHYLSATNNRSACGKHVHKHTYTQRHTYTSTHLDTHAYTHSHTNVCKICSTRQATCGQPPHPLKHPPRPRICTLSRCSGNASLTLPFGRKNSRYVIDIPIRAVLNRDHVQRNTPVTCRSCNGKWGHCCQGPERMESAAALQS